MAAMDIWNAGSCCINMVWNVQSFTPDEFLLTFAKLTRNSYWNPLTLKDPNEEALHMDRNAWSVRNNYGANHYLKFFYAQTPFVIFAQTGDRTSYGDALVSRIAELGFGEVMITPGQKNRYHTERKLSADKVFVWMPNYDAIHKWLAEKEKKAAPLDAYAADNSWGAGLQAAA